jgi:hypothetical protein
MPGTAEAAFTGSDSVSETIKHKNNLNTVFKQVSSAGLLGRHKARSCLMNSVNADISALIKKRGVLALFQDTPDAVP